MKLIKRVGSLEGWKDGAGVGGSVCSVGRDVGCREGCLEG